METAVREITEAEKMRAAINSPALSDDEFQLGDKTYKIVDLSYDSYIEFCALLKPVLVGLFSELAPSNMADVITQLTQLEKTNVLQLLDYCVDKLPEMVRIIVAQTDPSITAKEVKERGKNPFTLARIVMRQMARNHIIKDFADFFVQIAPMALSGLKDSNLSSIA